MIKTIGYARTRNNKKELENQVQLIENYCENHPNLELVDVIKEDDSSNISNPGFQQVLTAINNNQVNCLVVTHLDRITRKTVDLCALLSEFKNKNIKFHATNLGIDSQDVVGNAIINVLDILYKMSLFEKESSGNRIAQALQNKKRRGEHLGTPGLGYEVIKNPKKEGPGKLIENPKELEVVKEIKRSRKKGWSLPEICRYLENQGHKPKRGKNWYPSTVRYILNNPKFANIEIEEEEDIE